MLSCKIIWPCKSEFSYILLEGAFSYNNTLKLWSGPVCGEKLVVIYIYICEKIICRRCIGDMQISNFINLLLCAYANRAVLLYGVFFCSDPKNS